MKKIGIWLMVLNLLLLSASAEMAQPPAEQAVEALKQAWTEQYAKMERTEPLRLEIKNTRIVYLYDEFGDNVRAEEIFGGIDCIVECLMYVNLYGGTYCVLPGGVYTTVAVYEDGRMEALPKDLFSHYRALTYTVDMSGIVESIEDMNSTYNCIYMVE